MKTQLDILRNKDLKLYKKDTPSPQKQEEAEKPSPSEKVEFFEIAALKDKIAKASEVNLEKVRELKQRIKDGNLAVDAEKIADAMIEESLEQLE